MGPIRSVEGHVCCGPVVQARSLSFTCTGVPLTYHWQGAGAAKDTLELWSRCHSLKYTERRCSCSGLWTSYSLNMIHRWSALLAILAALCCLFTTAGMHCTHVYA